MSRPVAGLSASSPQVTRPPGTETPPGIETPTPCPGTEAHSLEQPVL